MATFAEKMHVSLSIDHNKNGHGVNIAHFEGQTIMNIAPIAAQA